MKSYEILRKRRDEDMWRMGLYVMSAVTTSIDMCINGKKSKSKYVESPLYEQMENNPVVVTDMELTEEEKVEYSQRWLDKLTGMMEKHKAFKGE